MWTRILHLCYIKSLLFTTEAWVRSKVSRVMVWKVALWQGFLRIPRVSPIINIPPMFHTYLHLLVALARTNGPRLGNSQKQSSFGSRVALDRNVLALFIVLIGLSGNTLAHFRQMSDSNFDRDTEYPITEGLFRCFLSPSTSLGQDCFPNIFNIKLFAITQSLATV